jgi:hypothetical protein
MKNAVETKLGILEICIQQILHSCSEFRRTVPNPFCETEISSTLNGFLQNLQHILGIVYEIKGHNLLIYYNSLRKRPAEYVKINVTTALLQTVQKDGGTVSKNKTPTALLQTLYKYSDAVS